MREYLLMGLGVTVVSMAHTASGAIIASGGGIVTIPAPVSVVPGALVSPPAYAFNELAGVGYAGPVDDLLPGVGMPVPPRVPVPGALPPGRFNSHFIHMDSGVPGAFAIGPLGANFVTFDGPIVAVIFRGATLDVSDAPLGAPGTLYPGGLISRGLELGTPTDAYVLLSPTTISIAWEQFNGIDQIRVITLVPAPGAALSVLAAAPVLLRRRRRCGA